MANPQKQIPIIHQIEYGDEDPMVRRIFEEACAKSGVQSQMEKYYKEVRREG